MERRILPASAKDVPRLGNLRASLNYDKEKPFGTIFWKYLCTFREMHCTASGVPATQFYQWADPEHVDALFDIADFFLQREDTGSSFWPDDTSHPKHNTLQISAHKPLIRCLLVQVFWRLNAQAVTNKRYKEAKFKKGAANRTKASDASTLSSKPTFSCYRPPTVTSEPPSATPSAPPSEPTANPEDASAPNRALPSVSGQAVHRRGDSISDPYEVSDSPSRSSVRDGQSSFSIRERTKAKPNKKKRANVLNEPAPKRQKKAATSTSSGLPRQRRKRAHGQLPVRNSPRTRKPFRGASAMATESEIEEALRSASVTPELSNSGLRNAADHETIEALYNGPGPEEGEAPNTTRPSIPSQQPVTSTADEGSFTAELQGFTDFLGISIARPDTSDGGPSIPSINTAPTHSTRDSSVPSSRESHNGSLAAVSTHFPSTIPAYDWLPTGEYPFQPHGVADGAVDTSAPHHPTQESLMVSGPPTDRDTPAAPMAMMGLDGEPGLPEGTNDSGALALTGLHEGQALGQNHLSEYMSSTRGSSVTANWPRSPENERHFQSGHSMIQELPPLPPVVEADHQTSRQDSRVPGPSVSAGEVPGSSDRSPSTQRSPAKGSSMQRVPDAPRSNSVPDGIMSRLESTEAGLEADFSSRVSQEPTGHQRKVEVGSSATHTEGKTNEPSGSRSKELSTLEKQSPLPDKDREQLKRTEAFAPGATPNFSFIIVHTRRPSLVSKQWIPKGKFLGKTLSQLMAELPCGFASDCLGLTFRWRGPGVATEFNVYHGDDGMFDFMRKNVRAELRESIRNYSKEQGLSFCVEIEGLQVVGVDEPDEEDELC